ncbi:hypothetical protein [Nocardioides psychrotolerans]|uniref:hypothetical protein n=1 Tax=Nocardioides psychrotolerans TaxID=1005945 RepID=UPI003137B605
MPRTRGLSGMPWARAATVILLIIGAFAVLPTPAATAADRNFAPRFTTNDTGDIDIVGNTVMTCNPSASGCTTATAAGPTATANAAYNNNAYSMVYVDVDSDATTFNSSRSTLALPSGATVLFAGLYWGGEVTAGSGGSAAPSAAARGTVKLKAPGDAAYSTITATTVDDGAIIYQGFADVTARVAAAGNGTYTVANLQTGTGADRLGGWSLVVAYRDTSQPARNLTVFDGLKSINGSGSGTISVSGFQTPPAGPVSTTVGFVTYEGDLGLVGDSATLNGIALSDAQHPATNFFDSKISRGGVLRTGNSPSYANNLGFDQSMLTVGNAYITNGATSATIGLTSSGDVYAPGVVTFATDLYAPQIVQTKTVTDVNGGLVEQGDTLRYTVSGVNNGQDGAAGFILRDPVPADTTYKPGSISVTQPGGTATARTDASGDDVAEYDAANDRVVARLGTGASSSAGGTIGVGSTYTLVFDVVVDGPVPAVASGTTIANTATASFNSASLGTALTTTSSATTTVAGPDLTVTKTHTGSLVLGADITYALGVSNVGPAASQGTVTVQDTLPAGLTFVSASGSGWTCSQAAGTITCTRADALAPGAAFPDIALTATVTDSAPATVANTVTVAGGGDGLVGNNSAVDSAPTVAVTDLSLAKTADVASVAVGGSVGYTLTVTNHGPSRSTGSTVVDHLPAGMSFVSADPGCVSLPSASTVTCTVGALASGASATIHISTRPDIGTAGSTLTNSTTVHAHENDPTTGNDTATSSVDVKPVDLQITNHVQGDPATLVPGSTYTWLLDVTNAGTSPAADSIVRFAVPTGLTVVAGTLDPRCHLDGDDVVCDLGTVGPGAVVPTIAIQATVASGGAAPTSVVTNAVVSTSEPDIDPGNNASATDTPVVAGGSDLSITKTTTTTTASPGDLVTYTLTVANAGPGAADDVVVSDALPAGTTYVSTSGAPCAALGQNVTCTLGSVPSGGSVVATVTVRVDPVSATTTGASHQLEVTKVETNLSLAGGQTSSSTVSCPSGYLATDGSVRLDAVDQGTGGFADALVLVSAATADGAGWTGTVRNGATGQMQAKVNVVCLSTATVTGEDHQHAVLVSAPVTSTATYAAGAWTTDLTCGPGRVAIAPGWTFTAGSGVVRTSQRSATGWRFVVDVPTSADVSFGIRCLSTSLGTAAGHSHDLDLHQLDGTVVVPPGATVELQLTCGDLEKGIVASWDVDLGLVSLGNDPQPKTRVFRFHNPTASSLTARVGLLCLGIQTGAESTVRDVVNTAHVSTSSTDADTADDAGSATFRVSTSTGPTSPGFAAGSTGSVSGSGSRTVVSVPLRTVKARTFTVRLVAASRVPGTSLRKGAVLARTVTRVAAGRHVVRLTARGAAAAALRAGRIDRASLVVVARDGSRSVRVITVR